MSIKNSIIVVSLLLSLLLNGCGGSSSSDNNGGSTSTGVALSGSVVKGPIANAEINIYRMNNDGSRGTLVAGPFTTAADGSWSGEIPASENGPFEVVATGGSYTDEASGSTVTLATGDEMLSVIPENTGAEVTAAITPLTHAIAVTAQNMAQGGMPVDNAARLAVHNSEQLFGFDVTQVLPPDPLNVGSSDSAEAKQYAALLGGLSTMGDNAITSNTLTGASRIELALSLAEDMADGKLDGQNISGAQITIGDGSGGSHNLPTLDAGGLDQLVTQTNTFAGSQANLNSTTIGALNGNLSAADAIAPIITAPDSITVNVSIGAAPVASTNAQIAAFLNGATAIDVIDGDLSNSISNDAPASFPEGSTPVTFSVQDSAGNVGTASATVTIVETDNTLYSVTFTISGASGNVIWEVLKNGSVANDGGNNNGTRVAYSSFANGDTYKVQVNTAPSGQTCSVSNGSGTISSANVTNVQITCSDIGAAPDIGFDLSALEFMPVEPTGLTPSAPTTSPIDVTGDIAPLYANVASTLNSQIFAAAPAGTEAQVAVSVDLVNGTYTLNEYDQLPDPTWARESFFRLGPDNLPLTADDLLVRYRVAPDYSSGIGYQFGHPGKDNIWFTSDDVINSNSIDGVAVDDGDRGILIGRLYPEDDGQYFTSDDTFNSWGYDVIVSDSNGYSAQVTHFDDDGSDSTSFTSDDRVAYYSLATFDVSGNALQTTTYNGAGSNSTWFDSDDNVQMYVLMDLDTANNRPNYLVTYNSAGTNGTWFDSDDVISSYTYFTYDENGNRLLTATHTGKGVDGIWFTGDDQASAILTLSDTNGNTLIEANISGIGADGKWLSADDTVSYYSYREYDSNNNQIRNAQFDSAGSDGAWFTADDVPGQWNFWHKELNAESQETLFVYHSGAGADGFAFTNDDIISQYNVSAYDTEGNKVSSLYVSNMGADGIAMTADDSVPYNFNITKQVGTVRTSRTFTGTPGADGQWFTSDDPLKNYGIINLDAFNNPIDSTWYDAPGTDGIWETADDVISEYRVRGIEDAMGSYDYVTYSSAGVDNDWMTTSDNTIEGYKHINVDADGRIISRTDYTDSGTDTNWMTADDVAYNVEHYSYNSNGQLIEQYQSGAGADGIFYTADDYPYYYTFDYNAGGEQTVATYWNEGDDGIYLTADDEIDTIRFITPVEANADTYASSTGHSATACNYASASSGTLNVYVSEASGNALTGAVVQLDQDGSTVTTDAAGLASFSSYTGAHDVHVFMNDYSWESFYCVEANGSTDIHAQLMNLTMPPVESEVPFSVTTTNYQSSSNKFVLMLFDSNGDLIGKSDPLPVSYTNTGVIRVDQVVGSTLTGDLWVFEFDQYGNDGLLYDAVQLSTAQSYTTAAVESWAGNHASPYEISAVLNDPKPDREVIASVGAYVDPLGTYGANLGGFAWGDVMAFPIKYDYVAGTTHAAAPDTVPANMEIDALLMKWNVGDYEWSYRQPLSNPTLPIQQDAQSSLMFPPVIAPQDAMGAANPVIEWIPASQAVSGDILTMTTLRMTTWISVLGDHYSTWTLHLPAGESQLTLPTIPASITSDNLGSSVQMWMNVDAVHGTNYQSLLSTHDIHQGMPKDVTTEVFEGVSSEIFYP